MNAYEYIHKRTTVLWGADGQYTTANHMHGQLSMLLIATTATILFTINYILVQH